MKKFERIIIYPLLFVALFFSFSGKEVQETIAQSTQDHIIAKSIRILNNDGELATYIGPDLRENRKEHNVLFMIGSVNNNANPDIMLSTNKDNNSGNIRLRNGMFQILNSNDKGVLSLTSSEDRGGVIIGGDKNGEVKYIASTTKDLKGELRIFGSEKDTLTSVIQNNMMIISENNYPKTGFLVNEDGNVGSLGF